MTGPKKSSKSSRSLVRCPITNNLTTRMAEVAFKRLCEWHQTGEDGYCVDVCRGKIIPTGLEFTDIESMSKEVSMASPKTPGTGPCAICDEIKSRKLVKGLEVCSSCTHVLYAAHGHPTRLVRALAMAGNESVLIDEYTVVSGATQEDLALVEGARLKLEEELSVTQKNLEKFIDSYGVALTTIKQHENRAVEMLSKIDGLELEIQKLGRDHEIDTSTIADLVKEIESKQSVFLEGTLSSSDGNDRASALLDLALDILDGVVQGVGAERIRALR